MGFASPRHVIVTEVVLPHRLSGSIVVPEVQFKGDAHDHNPGSK